MSADADATVRDADRCADRALDARSGPASSPRRRAIVALAIATIAVEILATTGALRGIGVGGLSLSAGFVPAAFLALLCGDRLLGRSTHRGRAMAFWAASTLALGSLAVAFARRGQLDVWFGLVLAAAGEELIYRLAIPLVLAIALRRIGVRSSFARPFGFAIAAVWFIALPGHVDQIDSAAQLAPFLAFATLSAVVVYRSGSVIPMAIAHATTNLLTVLLWSDATGAEQRTLGLVLVLGLLIAAYGERRRWTIGDDRRLVDTSTGLTVVELDLRDGHPPTATLSDGTVVSAEDLGQLPRAANSTPTADRVATGT